MSASESVLAAGCVSNPRHGSSYIYVCRPPASLKHFDDYEKYKHLLPIPFNPNTEEGKNITEFIEIKKEDRAIPLEVGESGVPPQIEKNNNLVSISEKIETD